MIVEIAAFEGGIQGSQFLNKEFTLGGGLGAYLGVDEQKNRVDVGQGLNCLILDCNISSF